MDTKKVETISLPYLKHDGKTEYGNFMAELNDATFGGNISAMEGTFSGTLTAQAVNAAANLNIAGQSVARTTISTRASNNNFDDDSRWRSIHSINFLVPNNDEKGGWFICSVRYNMSDHKGDNDHFPCRYRMLVNGKVQYTSGTMPLGNLYRHIRYSYLEVSGLVSTTGTKNVDIQLAVDDRNTNMYIRFTDIVMKVDYIRK